MKKKVAIFGGTFDPPHLGHLNLAISIKEAKGLDEVVFVPTSISPFKDDSPPTDPATRLELLELLIEGIEGFSIETCELMQKGPSYTVDTARELLKKWGEVELYFIIGEDQLEGLDRWKEVNQLIQLATPLAGSRRNTSSNKHKPLLTNNLIEIPHFDISSTEVRSRLKKGLFCGHLLPASILDRIQQNHLYCSPK